jgi:hypothetical protein
MKKSIIVSVSFLIISLSLSAVAEPSMSFDIAFTKFMAHVKTSPGRITWQDLNKVSLEFYESYMEFSDFLASESCRIFGLDYVLENKATALDTILCANLILGITFKKSYTKQEIRNLYNILLPVFCVCLLEKQKEESTPGTCSPQSLEPKTEEND